MKSAKALRRAADSLSNPANGFRYQRCAVWGHSLRMLQEVGRKLIKMRKFLKVGRLGALESVPSKLTAGGHVTSRAKRASMS